MIEKFDELNPDLLPTLKIIEPCCGKGVFLVELYKILKYKYKRTD